MSIRNTFSWNLKSHFSLQVISVCGSLCVCVWSVCVRESNKTGRNKLNKLLPSASPLITHYVRRYWSAKNNKDAIAESGWQRKRVEERFPCDLCRVTNIRFKWIQLHSWKSFTHLMHSPVFYEKKTFLQINFYSPTPDCRFVVCAISLALSLCARDFISNIYLALETRSNITYILSEFQSIKLFNLSRNVYILCAFIDQHPISINIQWAKWKKKSRENRKKIEWFCSFAESHSSLIFSFPLRPNRSIENKWYKKNLRLWLKKLFVVRFEYALKMLELHLTVQNTIALIVARTYAVRALFSSKIAGNMCACKVKWATETVRETSARWIRMAVIVRSINAEGKYSAVNSLDLHERSERRFRLRLSRRTLRMPTIILCDGFSLRASLE